MTPRVGDVVHYVSYGTPGGEYTSQCRAAIITGVDTYQEPSQGADGEHHVGHVSLAVLNPEGMFFNRSVMQAEPAETPGDPLCQSPHGGTFRYCPCGWMEAAPVGGTWHWPERVE